MFTKEDIERIEQYENDYSKLKNDMFVFIRRYELIDLLKVISEVFAEIKNF